MIWLIIVHLGLRLLMLLTKLVGWLREIPIIGKPLLTKLYIRLLLLGARVAEYGKDLIWKYVNRL